MQTHLSDTIDMVFSDDQCSAKYDASVKEMLSDKQILARILKFTLDEFMNYDINEIINCIDEPEVSETYVDPGLTNTGKVHKESEENSIRTIRTDHEQRHREEA